MELTLELVEQLRDEGKSWRQIGLFLADKLDDDPYRLQERARSLWRNSNRNESRDIKEDEVVTRTKRRINKDKSNVSEIQVLNSFPEILDNDGALKQHGYNPKYWRVIDSSCVLKNDTWTSRLKVVAREVPQLDKKEFADFLIEAMDNVPAHKDSSHSETCNGKIAVLGLFDLHYGRKGIEGDHFKSREDFENVIFQLCKKLKYMSLEKIIVPVGQDFLNSDTISGTTTHGTPQDNSLWWNEMITDGIVMLMWAIEMLEEYADVEVVYNEGNHDKVLSYAIIKALEARYYDSKNITVDTTPHPRKYIVHGETLVGLCHGQQENKLSTLMQVEVPELWGRSKHRYIMAGHFHHLSMLEADGVNVIRCPSLAFQDRWTQGKGFLGSSSSMATIIYSKQGLDDIWLMRP